MKTTVRLVCSTKPAAPFEINGAIWEIDASGARTSATWSVAHFRPTRSVDIQLDAGTYDLDFSVTAWAGQESLDVIIATVSAGGELILRRKTLSIDEPAERLGRVLSFSVP